MTRLGLLRFGTEFALAAGASALGYAMGSRLLHADSDWGMVGMAGAVGLFVLLIVMYALPYGVAVLILIAGMVTRRPGIMLGPIAFALGLLMLSTEQTQENKTFLADSVTAARALDQRAFLPHGGHGVIAVDGGGSFCRGICRQILAETEYDFATRNFKNNEPWKLYRRIEGDECLAPENHSSYLEFQADGYESLCAEQLPWRLSGDVLFVSANENNYSAAKKIVGAEFAGFVFQAYDRQGSSKRLIGRWIAGTVYAPHNALNATSGQDYQQIGKPFTPEEFFSALLEMPINPD